MITKKGVPIADLADWGNRAGPKADYQWKDGRSAKECARAWLNVVPPALPPEIDAALRAHPELGPLIEWTAEPEVCLPLDGRRGGTRNTDMLVLGRDQFGPVLVAIEAKADESFDATVSEVLVAGLEARLAKDRSGALARMIDLATATLQGTRPIPAGIGALRYQLFTASVGALREAEKQGIDRAVLLVHEFVTPETTDDLRKRNDDDLAAWTHRISQGQFPRVPLGSIVGPIALPGTPLLKGTVRLYVGKVSRDLRAPQVVGEA